VQRILIVEDHVELLEALAAMLGENYQVFTAHDGGQALALLDQQPVDLILLDLMMPVLDGATVVRTLRRRGDQTPVFLLSAVYDLARWASELQVSAAFSKPFDPTALQDSIARFFRNGGSDGPPPPPVSPGSWLQM